MNIDVRNLSFGYSSSNVLHDISFKSESGDFTAVLGSNGVGKSTLFRCLLGFEKKYNGKIAFDNKDIKKLSCHEMAGYSAYIPQYYSPTFNYTVLDTVMMGFSNKLNTFSSPGKKHIEKAEEVLDTLGILQLKDRGCAKISGGERQLALLARAMVQDAKILIMDEPTASLDYGNQHLVLNQIKKLSSAGYIIFMSTHDPNHALLYANRVMALKNGAVIADGKPKDVLKCDIIKSLYGVNVRCDSINGSTFCFPDVMGNAESCHHL